MEIFFDGEYYHVYFRGKNKDDLFLEENDYLRMMFTINHCNKINSGSPSKELRKKNLKDLSIYEQTSNSFVEMASFVLMPNHLHFMFKSLNTKFAGKFIKRILISYSKYFNNRYKEIGHVFESKYKIEHVNTQTYFDILLSYIKHNPIKLLDKNYKHIDLLNGDYKISNTTRIFLDNYPFFWQNPILTEKTKN